MVCSHKLKKFKLTGILNQSNYEIIVCDNCKNDPDLENFQEEVLQK